MSLYRKLIKNILTGVSLYFIMLPGLRAENDPGKNTDLFHFGLFFQTQLYIENHSYGNIYTGSHDDGLRIRRLRPSVYGNITPVVSYSLEPLFFSDFESYDLGMNNAHVKFSPFRFLDLKLGRFMQPFGGELSEDISTQVFPEKSRYWAYLFNENYGNGVGVDFHKGIFHFYNAFFYSFTDGYTVVREQDVVSKFFIETNLLASGISFFTAFKKFSGSELPPEIKGNFFISVYSPKELSPPVWKLSLGITGFFKDFESFNNAGEGAHISFEYLFLKRFKIANRFSAMYLARNLEASEIDLSRTDENATVGWAFDNMLTFAYYFSDQDLVTSSQNRISISYNPGYYLDGEIAHAMYVECVISF